MSVFFLYLNSKDRVSGTNTNAEILLRRGGLPKTFYISLEQIILPNTVYNISSARKNNQIYFYEDTAPGVLLTATFPDNNYSINLLATTLQSLLTTAGTLGYTVTFDTDNYRLNVATAANAFRFATGANNAYRELGVDPSPSFYSMPYTFPNPVSLESPTFCDVVCNFGGRQSVTSRNQSSLARVPLAETFGNVIVHKPCYEQKVKSTGQIETLTLQLRDENGRLVSLANNSEVVYSFKCEPMILPPAIAQEKSRKRTSSEMEGGIEDVN